MKYLRLFEFFTIEETEEQKKKRMGANSIDDEFRKFTQELVDSMSPSPIDVSYEIKDIFLECEDDGIELDDIRLSIPGKTYGVPYSVYYPLGCKYIKGNLSIYSSDTNSKILQVIKKNGKLYYEVTFGVDIYNIGKKLQNCKIGEIDYNDDNIKKLFDLVGECAEETFNRLSSMYDIKIIESNCFIPSDGDWVKCDPIPTQTNKSKISWLLDINQ